VVDHTLRFIKIQAQKGQNTGYISLIPSPGDSIWGVVYRLEQDDLKFIDRYEEVPAKYKRHFIDIITDNGSSISAYTLFANTESPPAKPHDQLALAISGAKSNGLPSEYITKLEQKFLEFRRVK
jgi:gamma-glutamylcyclotransferase